MFMARRTSGLLVCAACNLDTFGVSNGASDDPGATTRASSGDIPTTTIASADTSTTTTSATATDDITTDDITTDGITSTGAAPVCQDPPECQIGEVEDGMQCGACGVLRRVCQPDCTWSALTCTEDLDTCAYWRLPTNARQWTRVPVDPQAPFAPKSTVLAAIDLGPQHRIYALTATTYHVLTTTTQTWTGAGDRDAIFPQIAGKPLYWADSLTNTPPDTSVTLMAGAEAFSYTFKGATTTFEHTATVPCCGNDWMAPNAPPTPYDVRDIWSRLDDPDGWLAGDPTTLCALDPPMPLYGYSVAVGDADGVIYLADLGYCFDFYPPVPYAQFTPFTYPGAPDNNQIGGAASLDGLWIFRGE